MKKIGFIVNPYAGMGGTVGLKGTDGFIREAFQRGASPQSPQKSIRFLSSLSGKTFQFFTAGGDMGESELNSLDIPCTCVYRPSPPPPGDLIITSSDDTKKACSELIHEMVDLVVFCGGDGTARDVFSCIHDDIPILGIPAGVKIYSGVFATTPENAARTLLEWDGLTQMDGEILDVDEEKYRKGTLNTELFGIAKIPFSFCIQSSKQVIRGDESHEMHEIAVFIGEVMRDDTLYLLGAGSTTKAIAEYLGLPKTLLGIDAVYQKQVIAQDLNESELLSLVSRYEIIRIILSPIGAQGFILGRGNQQISHNVLKKTGLNSVIVVATQAKMTITKKLFIDTGDPEMNNLIPDSIQVICGYRMAMRVPVFH